jgi:hypothetical protein
MEKKNDIQEKRISALKWIAYTFVSLTFRLKCNKCHRVMT